MPNALKVPKCRGTGSRCQNFFLHLLPLANALPLCRGCMHLGAFAREAWQRGGVRRNHSRAAAELSMPLATPHPWEKVVSGSPEPWLRAEIWNPRGLCYQAPW